MTGRRSRRAAYLACFAVALAWLAGPLFAAIPVLVEHRPWNWTEALAVGLGYGVVQTAVIAFSAPRRSEGEKVVRRAISTGTLPDQAQGAAWQHSLEHRHQEMRVARWILLGYGVVVVGLVIAAAIEQPELRTPLGVYAVLTVVLAVAFARWAARQIRTAKRLLAELEARAQA